MTLLLETAKEIIKQHLHQIRIVTGYYDRIAAGNNLRVELLFYQFEMRVVAAK